METGLGAGVEGVLEPRGSQRELGLAADRRAKPASTGGRDAGVKNPKPRVGRGGSVSEF